MNKIGELSGIGKIMRAFDLSKFANVGCTLTIYDVIEITEHIKSLHEALGLERDENKELRDRIERLEKTLHDRNGGWI